MKNVSCGVANLYDGYNMPLIGLGTFRCTDESVVSTAVDSALNVGYRLFDTGHYYENEQQLGNALNHCLPKYGLEREDIFLTTAIEPAATNKEIFDGVSDSLRKLNTEYLDLVLVQYPRHFVLGRDDDPMNPVYRETTWHALEQLRDDGIIRLLGVSSYEIRDLNELMDYAGVAPTVNQCECHPRMTRKRLRTYCAQNEIHFQAFTSLARFDACLMSEPILHRIARNVGASVPQVLLAWALKQGISVLPKSQNPARIEQNYCAKNVALS